MVVSSPFSYSKETAPSMTPSTWEWRSPGLSAEVLRFTRRGSIEPPSRKFFCENVAGVVSLAYSFFRGIIQIRPPSGRLPTEKSVPDYQVCAKLPRPLSLAGSPTRGYPRELIRLDLMTTATYHLELPEEGLTKSSRIDTRTQTGDLGSSLSWKERIKDESRI